jgi:catechol 2,3-dioxygenase-like lactoylglutathione lyase family enzyme
MDFRLEVVVVPVSDVDRAKAFYRDNAGFIADHDTRLGDEMRIVQLTPPGSACSIVVGTHPPLPDMAPGSVRGLQLVVADIAAARDDLLGRGLEVSEIEELGAPGRSTVKFAYFADPDGNSWAVQEEI